MEAHIKKRTRKYEYIPYTSVDSICTSAQSLMGDRLEISSILQRIPFFISSSLPRSYPNRVHIDFRISRRWKSTDPYREFHCHLLQPLRTKCPENQRVPIRVPFRKTEIALPSARQAAGAGIRIDVGPGRTKAMSLWPGPTRGAQAPGPPPAKDSETAATPRPPGRSWGNGERRCRGEPAP